MHDDFATRRVSHYRIHLLLILIPLSVMFFIGGSGMPATRAFKEAWNIGHIIYFALLPSLLFVSSRVRALRPLSQGILVIAITICLGLCVELLQYGVSRSPDLGDMFRNVIGACVAIFFILPLRKSMPVFCLRALQAVTLALVVYQLMPTGMALLDEHRARTEFPVLSDFESSHQLERWGGRAGTFSAKDPEQPGNTVMRAHLTTDTYSGVFLKYFPGDWQGYNAVQFRIYNTSPDPLEVTCRIHDKQHRVGKQRYEDRFNLKYMLNHGWNTVTIDLQEVREAPAGRQLDLSQIQKIGIFVSRQPQSLDILLDDLKLF